jgi:hypothetical protein
MDSDGGVAAEIDRAASSVCSESSDAASTGWLESIAAGGDAHERASIECEGGSGVAAPDIERAGAREEINWSFLSDEGMHCIRPCFSAATLGAPRSTYDYPKLTPQARIASHMYRFQA